MKVTIIAKVKNIESGDTRNLTKREKETFLLNLRTVIEDWSFGLQDSDEIFEFETKVR